jgi:hypothetical protein
MDQLKAAVAFIDLIKDLPEDVVEDMLLVSKGMAIVARDQQKSA